MKILASILDHLSVGCFRTNLKAFLICGFSALFMQIIIQYLKITCTIDPKFASVLQENRAWVASFASSKMIIERKAVSVSVSF